VRNTFVKIFTKSAKQNPHLFLITADLGFGVLMDFAASSPNQFLNVGVAEQNMTGIATGLALEGRTVFTYSIANFPTLRCLEQIRNDAAYHEANVKIVAVGGGFSYGSLGMSHHATEEIAIMRALPITVVVPGDLWEVEEATKAIIEHPGTCYLRLDHTNAGYTNKENEKFELGKARRLKEGGDITLIASGGILSEVLAASAMLEKEGVSCRVVSMHTLSAIDEAEVFAAARDTGGIVTVEEHTIRGGLGSAVAELCLEGGVAPKHFYRIGLRAGFSTIVGQQSYLRKYYGLDKTAIVDRVKTLLS
jgi:transketolase